MLAQPQQLFEGALPAEVETKPAVNFPDDLKVFREFGEPTRLVVTQAQTVAGEGLDIATYVNEFWTAKQRQAHSLQEISYRACFKPQLPRFFIERLTQRGEIVYDP